MISVFVLNIHYRNPETHQLPPWMRYIFLNILPKFLLMARPKSDIPLERRVERLVIKSDLLTELEIPLQSVISSIRTIADNVRREEEILQDENDWKFVAMVIDRSFLWIFVLVCIVGTTTLFVQPLGNSH